MLVSTRRLFAANLAMVVLVSWTAGAQAQIEVIDTAKLEQLQQIINRQQQLLEQQIEQLKAQAGTIDALKNRVDQLEQESRETKAAAAEAKSTAEQAIVTMQEPAPGRESAKVVGTDNADKIKLAISGHINRAVNIAGDGDDTKAYFVDNDVSNSRVRFVGTGAVTDETTLGSRMEIAFSPNNSFDVSQDDESPGDFIDVRKVEAFARDDS